MAEKVDTVVELTSAGVESNCNYHSRDEEVRVDTNFFDCQIPLYAQI